MLYSLCFRYTFQNSLFLNHPGHLQHDPNKHQTILEISSKLKNQQRVLEEYWIVLKMMKNYYL